MLTNSLTSNYTHIIASSDPVGRVPVGEEDSSLRTSPFKPVEQTSETSKSQSAPGDKQPTENKNSASANDADSKKQSAREKLQEEQDQKEISKLATRDREVRAHEQAHMSVGGQYAGAAKFQYERGPDGVSYAVSGEVPIDMSKENSPQETIRKAQIVRRAALAPAEPSPQDRQVAAEASRIQTVALQELQVERRRELNEAGESGETENTVKDKDVISNDKKTENNNQRSVDREPVYVAPEGIYSLSSRLNASIANTEAALHSPRQGSILDQIV